MGVAVAVLLAYLPLQYVLWIISAAGSDTPSSDYIFSIGIVDRVLSGTYDWTRFFRDTFIQGAHCMALPILARLAVVRVADWNIYGELYLTVAFFLARYFLLFDLLTFRTERRESLWLWPALSALIFAVAQVDVFTYGDAGLQIGLVQLGLTLGLWGLVRFPGTLRGPGLAALGGVIATWSGGGGLLTWPVLLLGLVVCGYRRPAGYGLLAVAGILAALPYATYVLSPPAEVSGSEFGLLPPDPVKFLAAIGQPLVYGMAADVNPSRPTIAVGGLGAILLALGGGIVWRYRRSPLRSAAVPALLLLTWGAVNIVATTMLRKGLLSWYSTSFLGFWVGLVGLVYAVWTCRRELPIPAEAPRLARLAPVAWCLATLGGLAALYFTSNLTYGDKVMFFLPSRAPASAAAVRHYRTAPTYAEELVFAGFSLGHFHFLTQLADPLERHGLSQFRGRQQWTMQGEFALDHVRWGRGQGGYEPYWTSNRGAAAASWKDYHHLDLLLPPAASASWKVRLPGPLVSAELRTSATPPSNGTAGTARVFLTPPGEPERELYSGDPVNDADRALRFPLTEYAGQEVTVRLTASSTGAAVFRAPRIDMRLRPEKQAVAPLEIRPANLDPADLPTHGGLDLGLTDVGAWRDDLKVLGAAAPRTGRLLPAAAFLRTARPVDQPLAGYERLALRVTAGTEPSPQNLAAIRVIFVLRQGDATAAFKFATLTLLPDGKPHTYTYPLRLLELDPEARLASMRLLSVSDGPLRLHDLRLVPPGTP